MRVAVAILVLCAALPVSAQSPAPGFLCDDVVPASLEDFWQKWEEADLVLYALPVLSEYSTIGNNMVSQQEPPPITENFQLRTYTVWKGPVSLAPLEVSTTWGFSLWNCGSPPGYCVYVPEACSLAVEDGVTQVFFLKLAGDRWEVFTAFGTGIYDLGWLETEVGEPVSVEATTLGSIKSRYR